MILSMIDRYVQLCVKRLKLEQILKKSEERHNDDLSNEIKTEFNNFPFFDLQVSGYDAKILGQKSNENLFFTSNSFESFFFKILLNFIIEISFCLFFSIL